MAIIPAHASHGASLASFFSIMAKMYHKYLYWNPSGMRRFQK